MSASALSCGSTSLSVGTRGLMRIGVVREISHQTSKVGRVTRLAALAALALLAGGSPREALPNLVELPPASLEVQQAGGHDLLRFTSMVENDGSGALVVDSTRRGPDAPFSSVQVLGSRRVSVPVALRYRQ